MADVIDFAKAKEDREPAIQGEAHCIDCNHRWQAVAPVGTRWLECPGCHGWKGTFVGPFEMKERFVCNCGCDLFLVAREGVRCIACGSWVEPWST